MAMMALAWSMVSGLLFIAHLLRGLRARPHAEHVGRGDNAFALHAQQDFARGFGHVAEAADVGERRVAAAPHECQCLPIAEVSLGAGRGARLAPGLGCRPGLCGGCCSVRLHGFSPFTRWMGSVPRGVAAKLTPRSPACYLGFS